MSDKNNIPDLSPNPPVDAPSGLKFKGPIAENMKASTDTAQEEHNKRAIEMINQYNQLVEIKNNPDGLSEDRVNEILQYDFVAKAYIQGDELTLECENVTRYYDNKPQTTLLQDLSLKIGYREEIKLDHKKSINVGGVGFFPDTVLAYARPLNTDGDIITTSFEYVRKDGYYVHQYLPDPVEVETVLRAFKVAGAEELQSLGKESREKYLIEKGIREIITE